MNLNQNLKNVDVCSPGLKYFKVILSKVSFDKNLFEKELKKAIGKLKGNEINELKHWCYENYETPYAIILKKCFKSGPVKYQ